MKRNIKKYEKVDTYLSIILKLIPIFITVFFIGSVIFNIFYFSFLNLEWLNILSLPDYYEGSLFSICYLLVLVLTCVAFDLTKKIIICWKDIVIMFVNINKMICPLLINVYKQYFSLKYFKEIKFASFHRKRKYCDIRKRIKELRSNIFKILCRAFKCFIKALILILLATLLLLPLYLSFYINNKRLLLISIFTYLYFLFVNRRTSNKYIVFFLLFCLGMGNIGIYMSSLTLKDNKIKNSFSLPRISPVLVQVNGYNYNVIRIISKGVIAKDDKKIYFFKWEDVEYLSRENNRINKNDKK